MIEALGLCAVAWLLGFWLLWRIRLCGDTQGTDSRTSPMPDSKYPTRISVIIPARNEERRLPDLLKSLGLQRLPADEIIVVDDHSTDKTAAIATAAGARLIAAGELPPSWTGKSWACWLGALASRGELLVFLDADTTLAPDGLAKLLGEYERVGGLVSVQPYHDMRRAYERLCAIANVTLMMGMHAFTPLGQRGRPDGTFGPCIVCGREDYFRSGGHRAAHDVVLEDYYLGRSFLEAGMPVTCLAGLGTVSFRMYPDSFGQMVEGWSKTFGSGSAGTSFGTLLLICSWALGALFTVVLGALALGEPSSALAPARVALNAALYVAYALQIEWMLRRIGSFGRWPAYLFPVTLAFTIAVAFRATVITVVKGQVRWKGRDIATRPLRDVRLGRGTK